MQTNKQTDNKAGESCRGNKEDGSGESTERERYREENGRKMKYICIGQGLDGREKRKEEKGRELFSCQGNKI